MNSIAFAYAVQVAPYSIYHTPVCSAQQSNALRCKCKRRISCAECRRYWVTETVKKNLRWLGAADKGMTYWCGTLKIKTLPSTGRWKDDCEALMRLFSQLGAAMSLDKRGGRKDTGLREIVRAIGGIHYLNKLGEWAPHIHHVFTATSAFDPQSLVDAWQGLIGYGTGSEYVHCELVLNVGKMVRYSVRGEVPKDPQERLKLAKWTYRVQQIRKIGQKYATEKARKPRAKQES